MKFTCLSRILSLLFSFFLLSISQLLFGSDKKEISVYEADSETQLALDELIEELNLKERELLTETKRFPFVVDEQIRSFANMERISSLYLGYLPQLFAVVSKEKISPKALGLSFLFLLDQTRHTRKIIAKNLILKSFRRTRKAVKLFFDSLFPEASPSTTRASKDMLSQIEATFKWRSFKKESDRHTEGKKTSKDRGLPALQPHYLRDLFHTFRRGVIGRTMTNTVMDFLIKKRGKDRRLDEAIRKMAVESKYRPYAASLLREHFDLYLGVARSLSNQLYFADQFPNPRGYSKDPSIVLKIQQKSFQKDLKKVHAHLSLLLYFSSLKVFFGEKRSSFLGIARFFDQDPKLIKKWDDFTSICGSTYFDYREGHPESVEHDFYYDLIEILLPLVARMEAERSGLDSFDFDEAVIERENLESKDELEEKTPEIEITEHGAGFSSKEGEFSDAVHILRSGRRASDSSLSSFRGGMFLLDMSRACP